MEDGKVLKKKRILPDRPVKEGRGEEQGPEEVVKGEDEPKPLDDPKTMLEQGRVEEFLKMVEAGELTLHTKEQMDLFRQRARDLVSEKLEFELALEEVKAERDTLLKAVVVFHKNFGFLIQRAIDIPESQGKIPSVFVKVLKTMFGIELPPDGARIVWEVITVMRQNLEQIKASFPQMGSMLPEIVAILNKYNLIPDATTKKIEGGQDGQ